MFFLDLTSQASREIIRDIMRTTISLNGKLLDKAKKLARAGNMSLGQFIEQCIQKTISAKDKENPPKKFTLLTVTGELVDPHVNLDRTSELVTIDDKDTFAE